MFIEKKLVFFFGSPVTVTRTIKYASELHEQVYCIGVWACRIKVRIDGSLHHAYDSNVALVTGNGNK